MSFKNLMNQKFLTITFFVVLMLSSNFSKSQDKVRFLEIGLGTSHRTNSFKSASLNTRFSFDFSFLKQIRQNEPLFWGIHSYYFTLGQRSQYINIPFNFGTEEHYFSTTSNVWGNSGFLRFYPDLYLGKMELFFEAHLGFKYLFTVTSRSLDSDSDTSEYISESHSMSLSYGAYMGIQYPISDRWYLKTITGYLPGISARYYEKNTNSTINDSTIEGFDSKKSPTDIFRLSLGITYRF